MACDCLPHQVQHWAVACGFDEPEHLMTSDGLGWPLMAYDCPPHQVQRWARRARAPAGGPAARHPRGLAMSSHLMREVIRVHQRQSEALRSREL